MKDNKKCTGIYGEFIVRSYSGNIAAVAHSASLEDEGMRFGLLGRVKSFQYSSSPTPRRLCYCSTANLGITYTP